MSVCDSKKLAFNGNRKCKGNADMMSCTISCPDSIKFTFEPAEEYICYYNKGIFEPQHIPECNYNLDTKIISFNGSTTSYLKYTTYVTNSSNFLIQNSPIQMKNSWTQQYQSGHSVITCHE